MSIVVMYRKVADHMQTRAREHQLKPANFQSAKDEKEHDRHRNRVEDVKKVLPVFFKIESAPNF